MGHFEIFESSGFVIFGILVLEMVGFAIYDVFFNKTITEMIKPVHWQFSARGYRTPPGSFQVKNQSVEIGGSESPIRNATIEASAQGLYIETLTSRSLIPWDAIESYANRKQFGMSLVDIKLATAPHRITLYEWVWNRCFEHCTVGTLRKKEIAKPAIHRQFSVEGYSTPPGSFQVRNQKVEIGNSWNSHRDSTIEASAQGLYIETKTSRSLIPWEYVEDYRRKKRFGMSLVDIELKTSPYRITLYEWVWSRCFEHCTVRTLGVERHLVG